MISKTRTKALVIKEFLQLVRDPSALLIGFGLPLLLMFLYGYGVSLDLDHLRLGVVLEESSPDAQRLLASFTNSPYFEVTCVRDRRELTEPLLRGDIRGFVVIPSYFSCFRKRPNRTAPLQVVADGSETNTANLLQNYVAGAWQVWLQQERLLDDLEKISLINVEPRFWYNEELESRNFLLPGSMAIVMTLIGTLLTALVVAREWERGTMEALISTPVTVSEILIGKFLPYFTLGMGAMALCVAIAVGFYGVPFRGSYLVLFAVSALYLLPALGQGLLISTLARDQFVASQAAIVSAFLPAFILSGFLFDFYSMPTVIRTLTYILPARYFVSSLQTLFLTGNVWPLLLVNVSPMVIIGVLLLALTKRKMVKKLE